MILVGGGEAHALELNSLVWLYYTFWLPETDIEMGLKGRGYGSRSGIEEGIDGEINVRLLEYLMIISLFLLILIGLMSSRLSYAFLE